MKLIHTFRPRPVPPTLRAAFTLILVGLVLLATRRASFAGPVVAEANSPATTYTTDDYVVTYRPYIVTAEVPPIMNGGNVVGGSHTTTPGVTAFGVDHDGVGRLFIDNNPAAGFGSLCTASLLETGMHFLTAAHCVTDGGGNINVIDGADGNSITFITAGGNETHSFVSSGVTVHPTYDGSTLHGFDVAVVKMDTAATAGIPRYQIVDVGDADISQSSVKVGFGTSGHGQVGVVLGGGTKRAGQNEWEDDGLAVVGITNPTTQLTYDFDNGVAANDAFGFFFATPDAAGFGQDEVNSAPGDSGGPTFVNDGGVMKIAGVTSYGITLNSSAGTSDFLPGINSSFGEFSVDARVSNASVNNFIATAVPEPSSWLFMGLFLGGLASHRSLKWGWKTVWVFARRGGC